MPISKTMPLRYGPHEIRGVLMDLDGTLYRQRPLRWRMIRQLLLLPFRKSPSRTKAVFKIIKTFRRVREELRELGRPDGSLDRLQYEAPAERLGCDAGEVEEVIREWMHRRPLKYLAGCLMPGTIPFLDSLLERDVAIGVFSDYPPAEKLKALGLDSRLNLQLCATDPEINAFKPHPRGFKHACEQWGLQPAEVLYIGDRADVDAAGARAAGMPCALVGDGPDAADCRRFPEYNAMRSELIE